MPLRIEPLTYQQYLSGTGQRFAYAQAQWAAIAKTLPPTCDRQRVRNALEIALSEFKIYSKEIETDKNWSDPSNAATNWKRVKEDAAKLIASIGAADDPEESQLVDVSRTPFGDGEATRAWRKAEFEKMLFEVRRIEQRGRWQEWFWRDIHSGRGRRKNPARAMLYMSVISNLDRDRRQQNHMGKRFERRPFQKQDNLFFHRVRRAGSRQCPSDSRDRQGYIAALA